MVNDIKTKTTSVKNDIDYNSRHSMAVVHMQYMKSHDKDYGCVITTSSTQQMSILIVVSIPTMLNQCTNANNFFTLNVNHFLL